LVDHTIAGDPSITLISRATTASPGSSDGIEFVHDDDVKSGSLN
jgi:hypothetical protein